MQPGEPWVADQDLEQLGARGPAVQALVLDALEVDERLVQPDQAAAQREQARVRVAGRLRGRRHRQWAPLRVVLGAGGRRAAPCAPAPYWRTRGAAATSGAGDPVVAPRVAAMLDAGTERLRPH